MNDNNILAVVLAGGKSKRFGEDKNQAKLGNITLLEHVLGKVTKKFKKTLIISNQDLNIKTEVILFSFIAVSILLFLMYRHQLNIVKHEDGNEKN